MKNIRIIMLISLLVAPVFTLYAQVTSATGNEITRKFQYQYSFEGSPSVDLIKQTEEAIAKLLHVTEVKSVFKTESGRGQFLITIIEKDRSTESEELFSPKMVKEVILQNGLQPLDFTVTEEIIK